MCVCFPIPHVTRPPSPPCSSVRMFSPSPPCFCTITSTSFDVFGHCYPAFYIHKTLHMPPPLHRVERLRSITHNKSTWTMFGGRALGGLVVKVCKGFTVHGIVRSLFLSAKVMNMWHSRSPAWRRKRGKLIDMWNGRQHRSIHIRLVGRALR